MWLEYEELRDDFALAMPQIYILVEPPDEGTAIPDWLSTQSQLVLSLRLTPGIANVQSLFALRRANESGGTRPLIDPDQPPESIEDLRALT